MVVQGEQASLPVLPGELGLDASTHLLSYHEAQAGIVGERDDEVRQPLR